METKVREIMQAEEAEKIAESMNENYNINCVYDMIRDNKIEFEFNGKNYRVRLLNLKEKGELDTLRREKFVEFLQDKTILTEKVLIKLYKEKEIDIDKMDKDIKKIKTQIDEIYQKLGQSLANKAGEVTLKELKLEIEKLLQLQNTLIIQKNHLLECSLESQLQIYVIKLISYLSLDINQDGNWIRAFANLESFLESEETFVNFVGMYTMALQNKI